MKKMCFFLFLIFLVHSISFGQDDEFYSSVEKDTIKKENKEPGKWTFGGNFWLGFGSVTYIELSPVAMYRVFPRLSIGPGFTYIYQNYKYFGISTSTYGVRAIGTYYLFKNLNETLHINIGDVILHAENEAQNIEIFDNSLNSAGRVWIDNLLVGGGLFQPIGNRGGGLSILLLFDVTQNPYSPYNNPIFRVGFYF
jgi:hypothetical protein